MSDYQGVAVSAGRVIAKVKKMAPPVAEPPESEKVAEGADLEAEAARIATAADKVRGLLEQRAECARGRPRC